MSAAASRGPARDVLLGLAVAVAGVLPPFLLGALAVQLGRDLDFGAAGLGLATAAFFAISALASVPLGRLGERLGGVRAMRTAALGSAACLAGVAALALSFEALLGILVAGGLANALAQPAVNAYLAGRVAPERQALVFGIKQSAIPAAVLVSGISLPLVALTVGWRFAFAGAALAALGAALAVPGRERASEASMGLEAARDLSGAEDEPVAAPRVRALAPLAVAAALGAFSGTALGAFLVTTSVEAGIAEGSAGVLLAVGSAVSLGVRVGAGWLADRLGSEGLVPIVGLLLAGTAGFGLIAVGSSATIVAGTIVAFGAGWGWPGLFNFAVVVRHPRAAATATGITQTGVYAGAGFGPLLFGQIVELSSLTAAWSATAVSAGLAAAIVFVTRVAEPASARTGRPGGRPSVGSSV